MSDEKPNLSPEACRAARAILKIGVRELADLAGISSVSISAYENGRPMRDGNRAKLQATFEGRGVEILNGDSPGARMRPAASDAR